MSNDDNENINNHNKNNSNNRPVGQPPPAKRQRLYTDYDEFVNIIKRLSDRYNPVLFACIRYINNKGLICEGTCKKDK